MVLVTLRHTTTCDDQIGIGREILQQGRRVFAVIARPHAFDDAAAGPVQESGCHFGIGVEDLAASELRSRSTQLFPESGDSDTHAPSYGHFWNAARGQQGDVSGIEHHARSDDALPAGHVLTDAPYVRAGAHCVSDRDKAVPAKG